MEKQNTDIIRQLNRKPEDTSGRSWLESSRALDAIRQEEKCRSQIRPSSLTAYNNVAELAKNSEYWSRS